MYYHLEGATVQKKNYSQNGSAMIAKTHGKMVIDFVQA